MSKMVKDMITDELRARYSELNSALWIEMVGIDGVATNQFRGELRDKSMRVEIVKNSLFQRAVGDGALKPLADALIGPAAILTGGDSLIDVAKVVAEWMPRAKGLKLRGAVLEGKWLDEQAVAGLSKMPTKADLQAKIAAIILTPAGNIVSAVNSGGGNIAGCLKAMVEKLEDGEEITKKSA